MIKQAFPFHIIHRFGPTFSPLWQFPVPLPRLTPPRALCLSISIAMVTALSGCALDNSATPSEAGHQGDDMVPVGIGPPMSDLDLLGGVIGSIQDAAGGGLAPSTGDGAGGADGEESLGKTVDVETTFQNFLDYIAESTLMLQPDGSPLNWLHVRIPQFESAIGLGPLNVLSEFGTDIQYPSPPLQLLENHWENPAIPAINRIVVGLTENEGYLKPHIPPLRWSADGRLGVNSQVGGPHNNPFDVQLYLTKPEQLDRPLEQSAPGPQTLDLNVIRIPFKDISPNQGMSIQHTNICDPFTRNPGARNNPYACGAHGQDDCYDVTLISSLTEYGFDNPNDYPQAFLGSWDRIIGTPLHVRVSNPKTDQAKIAKVSLGETQYAPLRTGILFETITPADGRLLVARRSFMPLLWRNTVSGEINFGSYDIVYGVIPPEAEPCDVSYWSELFPISHAPHDERINSRYGFAEKPFRDPSGNEIPDGADLKGTYPWMDKEAKMLSMQVSSARLYPRLDQVTADNENPITRYPVRCVSTEQCSHLDMRDTDTTKDNTFAILGKWTQGKIVLLDGLLNDIDYKLDFRDRNHSYIKIYKPGSGLDPNNSGEVRVGGTRTITVDKVYFPVKDEIGNIIGTYDPANPSLFDSIENRLNYLNNFKQSIPHDVVWWMSSGHSTEQVSFDDYLNPNGFIVSNMVAYFKYQNNDWYRMTQYDGWRQNSLKFNGQVAVQNSATATYDYWRIPDAGYVYNGRLEPVANGGITGKGLWFNGRNTRLEYTIGLQPRDITKENWYYGLFVDPRQTDNKERLLIRFPDNSRLVLKGLNRIRYYNFWGQIADIDVQGFFADNSWTHIGLLVHPETESNYKRRIDLYINGLRYHTWTGFTDPTTFRPTPGQLRLGSSLFSWKEPFKGWIDEFKVFAMAPDPESACNFAAGTLVGLSDAYQGPLSAWADAYPDATHDYMDQQLSFRGQETYENYACYRDYTKDDAAILNSIPPNTSSLRASIHFPEGPLYHDAPRPDSSHNQFCLSCHTGGGVPGLDINALTLGPTPAAYDRRRQPSQPPPRVYGVIPTNWLHKGNGAFDSGNDGLAIDEWLLPSSTGVGPEVRNLKLTGDNGRPVTMIDDGMLLSQAELKKDDRFFTANVNGLTRKVEYTINGRKLTTHQAPYSVAVENIRWGYNSIRITAYLEDGTASAEYRLGFWSF